MKKIFVIHPFLFAIYPIFFLYSYNVEQTSFSEIIQPIIIMIPFVLLMEILLYFILKNKKKAALLISLSIFMFFTYGHFHHLVESLTVAGFNIGRNKYFLFTWFVIFASGTYLILKLNESLNKLTTLLNIMGVVLFIIPIANVVIYAFSYEDISYKMKKDLKQLTQIKNNTELPNIYDIVLDGYGSSNSLKEFYGYDNNAFENYLKDLGFHINSDSRSNYTETRLSFSSYLNMEHISKFGSSVDFPMLHHLIVENKVMQILKLNGYKIVNISSNIGKIQNLKHADWNVKTGSFLADEFQTKLIQLTILSAFQERLNLAYFYREKILTALSTIGEVQYKIEKPFFVFAHIMPPHPPYVFGPNAESVGSSLDLTHWGEMWEQKDRYIDQVIFINNEIEKIVSKILSESKTEPIIIIHADHGPQLSLSLNEETVKARMRIFYAYYLPKNEKDFLHDCKTLVNTYPLILNNYFNMNFELLEDKSYFTDYSIPYKFIDVTDKIKPQIIPEYK